MGNPTFAQRNPASFTTTLSGEIGDPASTTDNSHHVISNPAGLTTTAILDGFIITGGYVNGNGGGGGMYNNGEGAGNVCSPQVRNCAFVGNLGTLGGGIFNNGNDGGNSSPILTNCLFLNNFALGGGAMFNNGDESGNSSPIVINCSFLNNNAVEGGGAMVNIGSDGGNSNPILTNCSFQNNFSFGGVMFNDGSNGGNSRPVLTNCVLFGNGGANTIFNQNASVTATYSLFDDTVTGVDISGPGNLTVTTSPFASTTGTELATTSPAIDAGDPNSTTASSGTVDLAGNPRFFNTGTGAPNRIDMGAYEFQGVTSFTVLGSGTATCASSPTITLSGSQTGVSYQLRRDGLTTGSAIGGTGAALSFGPQSVTGVYTVLATKTGDSNTLVMAQSATVVSSTAVPTVSIAPTSGTLTCSVTSLTLTATSSGTGLLWSNAATTQSITLNTAGTYSVTATGANGCSAVSNSVVIGSDTNAPTGANLTASNSGTLTCSVTSITLTATATGSSLSYVFAGPSGLLTGSGNTRPVSASGLYSVTITGANGCTTSASTTVFSNTATPTAGLMSSGTITCAMPTATITASGAGNYTFGGPGIVSTSGNSATVNVGGAYSVTVLNPANGCFAISTTSVSSDLGGTSAAPMLSASSSVVCVDATVQVVATGGASPMQWYKDGQAVVGQTSATLSLGGVQSAQAGSYVLVVSGACSVTSAPFMLTVNPLPTVTILVPNGATVQGATITLPAPLTGVNFQVLGGVSFERLIIVDRINGYEIRQVDSNASGIFPVTRTGPFRLTVTGANGCKRTVEGTIAVLLR